MNPWVAGGAGAGGLGGIIYAILQLHPHAVIVFQWPF
jgi:hypothetical protein